MLLLCRHLFNDSFLVLILFSLLLLLLFSFPSPALRVKLGSAVNSFHFKSLELIVLFLSCTLSIFLGHEHVKWFPKKMVNGYRRILGSPFYSVNASVIRLVWYCFSLNFPSYNVNVCVCACVFKIRVCKDVF